MKEQVENLEYSYQQGHADSYTLSLNTQINATYYGRCDLVIECMTVEKNELWCSAVNK